MGELDRHFSSLGFLGAGNMAGAILRGTVGRGQLGASRVWICDISAEKTAQLRDELGVAVAADPRELFARARAIVLAVKPQDLPALLTENRAWITAEHLLISIAAGLTIEKLTANLEPGVRIARVMPNTPALVGLGASGVAAGATATRADLEATLALFRAVGIAHEVAEADLDAVTAISGSGPAYVFRLMEIMRDAAIELGLEPGVAAELTLQTFAGAAQLAAQSGEPPEVLRARVTSKGGTTAAALATFDEQGLAAIFAAGIRRARERSRELARGE